MNRVVVSRVGEDAGRSGPGVRLVMWLASAVLVAGVVYGHRWVGSDGVYRGSFETGEAVQRFEWPVRSELPRADAMGRQLPGALIPLRLNGEMPQVSGAVLWREYPGDGPYSAIPMDETRNRETIPGEGTRQWTELAALLPPRPAGERLEYYGTLEVGGREIRLPKGDETITLRYRGFVPREILYPRILATMLALLLGMRAGLAGVFDPASTRRFAWAALALATIGGLTLGPIAQSYAIGEYWGGFPLGGDWDNNATLAIWAAWLAACLLMGRSTSSPARVGRVAAVVAACLMAVLFSVPYGLWRVIG